MRTLEASALNRRGVRGRCEIRPHAGGAGGYVIAVIFAAGTEAGRSGVLTHEDGAALRFADPAQARRMALRCGFTEDHIGLQEPATGDYPSSREMEQNG